MDSDHPGQPARLATSHTYVFFPPHRLPHLTHPSEVNSYLGMAICYLVMTLCYYNNVFNGRNLPWMSTSLFGDDGETYDQSSIITADYHLNKTALEAVGLPRYTTTYAISQLAYNLSVGASVTTIFLWYFPELKQAFGGFAFLKKGHAKHINDPHYKEMQKYREWCI